MVYHTYSVVFLRVKAATAFRVS